LKNRTNFTQDDLEEMREQALLNKIEFVEFVTDELMEELFFKVGMLGFNFEDQDFGKDVGLVIESLRSLILKSMGISHALQQAAEQLIDFSELDEEFEE
jgi:4-hydroxyphenylpyruvate dioxygenase-like putative hemolysin